MNRVIFFDIQQKSCNILCCKLNFTICMCTIFPISMQKTVRAQSGPLKKKKTPICYLVFLRKRQRWAFLNTLQALDPPTFKSFGLTFLRNDFEHQFFSKTARYRLFLAVVQCCVTTTLAAETFSLLSVYLNYKFGLGLPSFYLFFSLFKKKVHK